MTTTPSWIDAAVSNLPDVFQWGGWALFAWLLWYVYAHDEKLDRWLARFERFLLWIGFKQDRRYIRRDIQARINAVSKRINKEAEGVVTKGIEIKWIGTEDIESFLRNGKVVVLMKHHQNQDRNIAQAALHYAQVGVLHTSKRYLPDAITKALDLAVTRKILAHEAESSTATEYFSLNILNPELNNTEVKEAFTTIEKLEKKGLFTRILLREMRSLGKRLYPQQANPSQIAETKGFFSFLIPFADHERGDTIAEWDFVKDNIRVGIMYVAQKTRLDQHGLEPYAKRLVKKFDSGSEKIYLFARRKDNVNAVRRLVKEFRRTRPEIDAKYEYYKQTFKGEVCPSICVLLQVRSAPL